MKTINFLQRGDLLVSKKEKLEEKNETVEEVKQTQETPKNEELEKVRKELSETRDLLLRTAAEYDNFRKRSEREKDAVYSNAKSATIAMILPLADSLEAASSSSDSQGEE